MIKSWMIFNENSEDPDRIKLEEIVLEIKDIFVHIEDMSDVRLALISKGNEKGFYYGLSSKNNNLLDEIWSSYISIRSFNSRHPEKSKVLCICASMRVPATSQGSFNSLIESEGIEVLDEIIAAFNRLKSKGFDVKIDMNGNQSEYKPVTLFIYFSI